MCQTCLHNKIPHAMLMGEHLDLMVSGTRGQIHSINRICKVPKFAILPLGKKEISHHRGISEYKWHTITQTHNLSNVLSGLLNGEEGTGS